MIRKLRRPLTMAGREITQIEMDLDDLTGADLVAANRDAQALRGRTASVPELDVDYQRCVASRASGIPAELLGELSARDFTALTMAVRDFLLAEDSDEETTTAEDSAAE